MKKISLLLLLFFVAGVTKAYAVGGGNENPNMCPAGCKGDKGVKGDKGEKGDHGERGLTGLRGPKGNNGLIGPEGPEGPGGQQGPQGVPGPASCEGNGCLIEKVRYDFREISVDCYGVHVGIGDDTYFTARDGSAICFPLADGVMPPRCNNGISILTDLSLVELENDTGLQQEDGHRLPIYEHSVSYQFLPAFVLNDGNRSRWVHVHSMALSQAADRAAERRQVRVYRLCAQGLGLPE